MASCKKDKFTEATGNLEAVDYTWNVALKGFQPEKTVGGKLTTNINVKTLYYYIQRTGKADSLIQLDFPAGVQEYAFTVKADIWPNIDLVGVKGIKLLAVQDNNTSLEKLVKITYFNPGSTRAEGYTGNHDACFDWHYSCYRQGQFRKQASARSIFMTTVQAILQRWTVSMPVAAKT